MIAETLAGIALVKSAVDGIKGAIGTAKDISEIAGHIDNLFEGEKQVQQKRNSKSGVDNFGGIGGVASEVIDARLAKEKMQEVAAMVDMRFGPGTWKSIVDERARRMKEQRELEAKVRQAKLHKARQTEELFENILMAAAVVFIVVIAIAIFISII